MTYKTLESALDSNDVMIVNDGKTLGRNNGLWSFGEEFWVFHPILANIIAEELNRYKIAPNDDKALTEAIDMVGR